MDLCGGTGSWSKPYLEAGYDVRNITLPECDVMSYRTPNKVYGVLAAPPCTDFAVSGAWTWKTKDIDGRTIDSMGIVIACLRIIAEARPKFWALENPIGRLNSWLGKPNMYFQPFEYGDPYTKKTCLWGVFNNPEKNIVDPIKVCKQGSWVQKLGGKSERTKMLRSVTPEGFARAFFEANK